MVSASREAIFQELRHRFGELVAAGDVAGFRALVAGYCAQAEEAVRELGADDELDGGFVFLQHESPLALRDVEGCTLLMIAIEKRQAQMIPLLYEASATCDVPDNRFLARPLSAGDHGRTLFHVAAVRGDRACLEALAALPDARPALPDGSGATPLHYAASAGRTELFEWLVAHGCPLESVDHEGRTPLYRTADDPAGIAALVRLGAHPDGAGNKRPIQVALDPDMEYDDVCAECTRLLLDAGADVRHVTCDAAVEQPAMLSRLLERGGAATPDALRSAAATSSRDAVTALLHHGAFDERDVMNAIRAAVRSFSWSDRVEDVLRMLLAHPVRSGAVPGASPSLRLTFSLLSAAERDGVEALTFVLGIGAAVDATVPVDHPLGADGGTALHVAAARLRVESVALLLDRGADPMARDRRGRRPIDLAQDSRSGPDRKAILARLAAAENARAAHAPGAFAVGDVVTHAKFGEGTIESVLDGGDAARLVIGFASGPKTVLSRFVQSKR